MSRLIAFLDRWTSLDHPTVLFALCIAAFVLICAGIERLNRQQASQPEPWHLPPVQAHHTPDWSKPAHKGLESRRVVNLESRRQQLQIVSRIGGRHAS